MTVYVDDMRLPARVGRIEARWSHLFSDNPDPTELHRLAAKIGLRRAWFQDKPSGAHYDVTDTKRRAAIAAGAVPIECGSPEWMRALEAQRSGTRTSSTVAEQLTLESVMRRDW
ncbi:DUF4031 domain-containing protein [Mycolicibacterium novocastrense]|uniref:DUF4031 domain-containing protein n=1 Tax=Mycolicibacterium novocastrense TaxID=59813 RepID=A0AAW5SQU6_MYCNV|nr:MULTISPECIES: DUF4031 domain-containing protein [Mycolicibacterium]MCV7026654.1 DUF4031 domain-containing protein [Mycolicibacterium novocastrense]MDX1887526.1 DUF4031 domain-containing protein [Mycolicibacterium sp. 120270]GAT07591.1 putative uncharacterized protein [Mycolicibacterium novocastrense]